MRAPEVFVQKAGAVVHRLDTTYRLGQETVDAIAPLYNFPFTSSRPDRYLTDENGNRVSEIIPLKIPVAPSFQHMDTMVTVAEYAANLVGTELVETIRDGVLVRRPLETLRLLTLLRVLHRVGGHALRGRLVTYVGASAAILSYAAALAVLDVERKAPDANITTMGDALWWAMATITTVGYGDQYPVTAAGRLIAAALMIGGIAVLGVVTASLASWLVESVTADTEAETESDNALRRELVEIKEQLQLLNERNSDAQHGP